MSTTLGPSLDPGPTLRPALMAHLVPLALQLSGLRKWVSIQPISVEAKAVLTTQIAIEQRRWDLVQTVLADLDKTIGDLTNLIADGYPKPPAATAAEEVITELVRDHEEMLAALGVFQLPTPVEVFFDDSAASTAVEQPVPREG